LNVFVQTPERPPAALRYGARTGRKHVNGSPSKWLILRRVDLLRTTPV